MCAGDIEHGPHDRQTVWHLERGAFAYGLQTDQNAIPKTGSGTYTGSMLATMVFNPTLDAGTGSLPNYFQWISGTSSTNVNFATGAVTLALNGIVGRPAYDYTASRATYGAPLLAFSENARADWRLSGRIWGSRRASLIPIRSTHVAAALRE